MNANNAAPDQGIEHSRDYSDPIAGARLLGRLPELVSALS